MVEGIEEYLFLPPVAEDWVQGVRREVRDGCCAHEDLCEQRAAVGHGRHGWQ